MLLFIYLTRDGITFSSAIYTLENKGASKGSSNDAIDQGSSTLDLEIHFPAEISSNLD